MPKKVFTIDPIRQHAYLQFARITLRGSSYNKRKQSKKPIHLANNLTSVFQIHSSRPLLPLTMLIERQVFSRPARPWFPNIVLRGRGRSKLKLSLLPGWPTAHPPHKEIFPHVVLKTKSEFLFLPVFCVRPLPSCQLVPCYVFANIS